MAAYHARRYEATGYSPNYLVFGRENSLPIDVALDLPPTEEPSQTYDGYVEKLHERLHEAYKLVWKLLGQAAERNKKYYDLRVRLQQYMLSASFCYTSTHGVTAAVKTNGAVSSPGLSL